MLKSLLGDFVRVILLLESSRLRWRDMFKLLPLAILMLFASYITYSIDPNRMKKDIAKLLRASRIG